ncbi:hypothetical protein DUNSADRAFT_11125 [Dunaliella salina]|uniref:RRM domain-containing protein n=1 Tax=Dunaliella salina TaxID=3046 RepID=A0ABQ7H4M0_DUNSA|nr:hypothetical protein DUNSADRAFT_11125 [Dunaliella salina]|eukprot:KAF5841809.1 hypothetical protein DUNSADRAFT_11125 [Dunaliella salina]
MKFKSPVLASIDLTAGHEEAGQSSKGLDTGNSTEDDVQGAAAAAAAAAANQHEQSGEDGAMAPSAEEQGGQQGAAVEGGQEQQHEGKKKKKVLSAEKLKRMKEMYNKRGVVYVSRIPPHMKPMKLKQLLSTHGETLRVYCAPEDPKARKIRKRKGGNTGKNFTEGWVEFADKRVAKRTALALNGQRIGGKRRSAYYDDLWCIKYLPHFKWDDLTEEIAYQRAVHEQKMAAEVSAAKKERDFYMQQVDRAKAMRAIAERRAAKQGQGETAEGGHDEHASSQEAGSGAQGTSAKQVHGGATQAGNNKEGGRGRAPFVRNFMQRAAKLDPTTDAAAPQLDEDVLLMVGNSKKKHRAS